MSATSGPRLAVNPIPYWLNGGEVDRSTANLGKAFEELADIGYTVVKADVPSDMEVHEYLPWLRSFGLHPGLSLFNGVFSRPERHEDVAEDAKRFAAAQAELGLDVTMISTVEPEGSRRTHPGIGHDFDAERMRIIVDGVRASVEAMRSEGIRAALHPHVGGWIETEHEVRTVLDEIGPELLAFGPDTGHMAWAGMDVPGVLAAYSERIVGLHLKDVFEAGVERCRAEGLTYADATRPGHLWAEPGRGDLDLLGCLQALPPDFAGDYMVEIDVPSVERRQCHQVAFDLASDNLCLAGAAS